MLSRGSAVGLQPHQGSVTGGSCLWAQEADVDLLESQRMPWLCMPTLMEDSVLDARIKNCV